MKYFVVCVCRSLQAAREATRPVAATTYARLLLERQGVLPATDGSPALFVSTSPGVYEGVDGVMRVIETACRSRFTRPHSGKARSCLPAYATIRQKCSMNYWQPERLSGRGKKAG
ncbi:ATP-dependent helicase [Escherichia coli]|uniref:ATP-dependent helicase n=1 Tax=Escherichia coli TaxID=562 RepID=A0A376S7B2_ECOLX|nr:ATP-dependent helicase [Escherichia coli]